MSLRLSALTALNRSNENDFTSKPGTKITAIFGENVFTTKTAREYLSDEAFKSLVASIKGGKKIDRSV